MGLSYGDDMDERKPDESAPEAVCLLDLVTAVETYRESAMRRITAVEGTAAQLRGALGQVHPLDGAALAGTSAQADQAMGAFMPASSLLEKFLAHYGVAE
jgi:hypothetical protein